MIDQIQYNYLLRNINICLIVVFIFILKKMYKDFVYRNHFTIKFEYPELNWSILNYFFLYSIALFFNRFKYVIALNSFNFYLLDLLFNFSILFPVSFIVYKNWESAKNGAKKVIQTINKNW